MAMPSSTGWNAISDLPSDRKDGRRMLLWDEDMPVIVNRPGFAGGYLV